MTPALPLKDGQAAKVVSRGSSQRSRASTISVSGSSDSSSSDSSDSDSSSDDSSTSESDGRKITGETAATVKTEEPMETVVRRAHFLFPHISSFKVFNLGIMLFSQLEPEQVAKPADQIPVCDTQTMIDVCLTAIKECVSRFPHFYKGHYRLAHYYYHSKVSHNIEACRELLFGRPLSVAIAQMQQQQGIAQPRFLPVGVAGLFAEWRYLVLFSRTSNCCSCSYLNNRLYLFHC